MSKKVPAVGLPKNVVIAASLGSRNGRVDRQYLRSMAVAIKESEGHRNANLRKLNRETSDV